MKNISFKVFTFLLIFFIGTACSEDWFKPQPLSFYSPENVFVDRDGVEGLLSTVRAGLRNEFQGGANRNITEYYWADLSLGAIWLSQFAHNAELQVLPTHEPQNSYIFWYFGNAYAMFKNVNLIISRIDDIEFADENERNIVLAEAYFHRAYHYYRLVHQFGDVPYIGKEIITPKTDFQTFSREAILKSIKEDMEFAVQWLPEEAWGGKENRAAGYHLLTKIYLSLREFDNAVNAASEVIDGGRYFLMTERFGNGRFANDPEYNVLWDLHQKENISIPQNKEAILVAQNAYEMEGNGSMSHFNRTWIPYWRNLPGCLYIQSGDSLSDLLGRGNSWIRGSNYFNYTMANEDPDDLRYSKHNWWRFEDFWHNDPNHPKYMQPFDRDELGIDTITTIFPFFYYKLAVPQDNPKDVYHGGYIDYYVFRLAETYLLRAEAYWWKGDIENAAKDVNAVRGRAQATQKSASDITLDYIFDERARELYREEPRHTELTRIAYIMASLNRDGYSLENMHEKNWYYDRVMRRNHFFKEEIYFGGQYYRIKPYHVYWPIPQSAIDSNTGGVINQNLGYAGSEKNVPPVTEITDED
jgi:starch-binding outer membrane protein, SusD/RagB family